MIKLSDFTDGAKGLTRNPIGIIGLFISLIYAFACLVLGQSLEHITEASERLPLIYFIVLFPIVILGVFIYLVVKHHHKLYAPTDFRDDGSFLQTMPKKAIAKKRNDELELIDSTTTEQKFSAVPAKESVEAVVPDQDHKASESDQERTASKEERLNTIRQAELLASKELSIEFGTTFRLNQRLATRNGKVEIDAIASTNDHYLVGEVKYWPSSKALKPLMLSAQEFYQKRRQLENILKHRMVKLLFVVVSDRENTKKKKQLQSFIRELGPGIELKMYIYQELLRDYGE